MEQNQFIRNGQISDIFSKPSGHFNGKFIDTFDMIYMNKKKVIFQTKVTVIKHNSGFFFAYASLEDRRFEQPVKFQIKKIKNENKWYISFHFSGAFKIISLLTSDTHVENLNPDGTIKETLLAHTLDFRFKNIINVGDEHDLIIENQKLRIRISNVLYSRVDATILNNEDVKFILGGKTIRNEMSIGHNYVSMWRGSNKHATKYVLDGVKWALDPTKQFVQSIIAEKGDVLALPKDIMGIVTTFL